jgi:hypothetical protein
LEPEKLKKFRKIFEMPVGLAVFKRQKGPHPVD